MTSSTAGATKTRRLEAVPVSDIQMAAVRWLWPQRIAYGTLTVLAGEPGLGKSLRMWNLAARLSRGELTGSPSPSLFLSGEEAPEFVIRPRVEAAGGRADLIHIVSAVGPTSPRVAIPDDIDDLRDLIESHRAELVVIDPLMAYLGDIDSHKDQSIREALAPLHGIAEQSEAAIVLVSHLNKKQDGTPLQRVGGSVGIGATAHSVLLMGRDPSDDADGTRRALAHVKSNLGPEAPTIAYEIESIQLGHEGETIETSRLRKLGYLDLTGSDLLNGKSEAKPSRQQEAVDFLLSFLRDGQHPANEVEAAATAVGISSTTLGRAKREIGVESIKAANGWSWMLPTAHRDDERTWNPQEAITMSNRPENDHTRQP
jgi:hypothetical protein